MPTFVSLGHKKKKQKNPTGARAGVARVRGEGGRAARVDLADVGGPAAPVDRGQGAVGKLVLV